MSGQRLLTCQVWWCSLVILALRKLRQEDGVFKVSTDYINKTLFQKRKKLSSQILHPQVHSKTGDEPCLMVEKLDCLTGREKGRDGEGKKSLDKLTRE
jgi:hypothetical protein